MEIFATIIGLGMTIASAIVQVALSILVLYIIARVTWYVVSNAWEIVHKKSYDSFVGKLKKKKSNK